YSFEAMGKIAEAITADYQRLDVVNSATFARNLRAFEQSLQLLQQKLATIKARYNGTPIGLTETICLYQTQPAGLDVLTPFEFEKAIAEANDPPAETVITATDQITNHQ